MQPATPGLVRFAAMFLAIFVGLTLVVDAVRGTDVERFVVVGLFELPAAALLNAVPAGPRVEVGERTLESPAARLRVLRGCEGTETLSMLAAAVLAYPSSARRRISGLAFGLPLGWALCVLRLALLYASLAWLPRGFTLVHGLIAPLAPVIVLAGYFAVWTQHVPRGRAAVLG